MRQQDLPNPEEVPPIEVVDMCEVYTAFLCQTAQHNTIPRGRSAGPPSGLVS